MCPTAGSLSSFRFQHKTIMSHCPCWILLSAFSPFLIPFCCLLSSLFIKVEYSFFRWLKPEYKAETSPVPIIARARTRRQYLLHSWGSDLFCEWRDFKIQCKKVAVEEKMLHSSFALGCRYLCYLITLDSCKGPFLASSEVISRELRAGARGTSTYKQLELLLFHP